MLGPSRATIILSSLNSRMNAQMGRAITHTSTLSWADELLQNMQPSPVPSLPAKGGWIGGILYKINKIFRGTEHHDALDTAAGVRDTAADTPPSYPSMVGNTPDCIREPNGKGGLVPAGSGWWPHQTGDDDPKRTHAVR